MHIEKLLRVVAVSIGLLIGGQRMHGFTVGRFELRLKDAGIIR